MSLFYYLGDWIRLGMSFPISTLELAKFCTFYVNSAFVTMVMKSGSCLLLLHFTILKKHGNKELKLYLEQIVASAMIEF